MKFLANPYVILALVLLLLGTAVAGYQSGARHARADCAADKLQAVQRAIDQAAAVARQDNAVLAAHEQARERIRTVFQPIRHEVIRYVQTHTGAADPVCLDADGVRIWRDANSGDAAPASPRLDYTLPTAAAADFGPRLGSTGEPRRDGGAVPRMQGTPQGAGGLGRQ